jgi:hypothetical protein
MIFKTDENSRAIVDGHRLFLFIAVILSLQGCAAMDTRFRQ